MSRTRVSGLSTLYFTDNIYRKVSMENEVRSRTFILDALSSIFTAHKTHTSSYIVHAAMHASIRSSVSAIQQFHFIFCFSRLFFSRLFFRDVGVGCIGTVARCNPKVTKNAIETQITARAIGLRRKINTTAT